MIGVDLVVHQAEKSEIDLMSVAFIYSFGSLLGFHPIVQVVRVDPYLVIALSEVQKKLCALNCGGELRCH